MIKNVCVIVFAGLVLLAGCQRREDHPFFEATVIEVHESSLIVEPAEDEAIRKSGSQVSVTTDEAEKFMVGDRVKVTHEGPVMESHPLQINLIDIEFIQ